jgi:translation initiation factor IF-3
MGAGKLALIQAEITNKNTNGLSSLAPRGRPKEKLPIQIQQIRVNGRIRAKEVRVIIASTNEQLGVMKLQDALRRAQSLGMDLVEVAPNAAPPVCRIVDFGKFRYEVAKQEKDKKQNTSKLKEIKFRVNIDEHDYLTKIRRGEQFLDKGNKLKVQLQFRGREMAHKDLGEAVMRRVRDDLATMAAVEMEPKQIGRSINMTLSPLPAAKRKRRFSLAENDIDEDHEDEDNHEGNEPDED